MIFALPFGEGGSPKGLTGEVVVFLLTSSVICSYLANATFPRGEGKGGGRER